MITSSFQSAVFGRMYGVFGHYLWCSKSRFLIIFSCGVIKANCVVLRRPAFSTIIIIFNIVNNIPKSISVEVIKSIDNRVLQFP